MIQDIILVNEQDEEIGYGEKQDVHVKAQLHRAFSIFIYDRSTGKMLIQKRASGKYHSGGLWTNACCSHPRKGESMEAALNLRLKDELGLNTDFHIVDPEKSGLTQTGTDVIYSCGKFMYLAPFGEVSEHEIDHVFLYDNATVSDVLSNITPNPEEIEEIMWISMQELKDWMKDRPAEFTAWFKPAFELAYAVLCSKL